MVNCSICNRKNSDQDRFCIHCGSELTIGDRGSEAASTTPYFDLEPGSLVGKYVIIKLIGLGGVGAVYLARHQLLKQTVAIKVQSFLQDNKEAVEAFFRASNHLCQLNHPNIIHLYDYGSQHGKTYQVMEYIEGGTLADIIPDRPTRIWTESCLEYFPQVLSALRHSHKQGITHGDIKPQNILIDKTTGNVKLADFMSPDLQRFFDRARGFSYNHTAAFGTPGYMAPEQEEEGVVYPQSDIFSLGVTFYEAMTCHYPGEHKYFSESRASPRMLNPDIPRWLDEMLTKAMKVELKERFQSSAEMESYFLINLRESQGEKSLSIRVEELFMGDQISNKFGDISNVSGQLFIGKFNDVVANLNATGQSDLAEALKSLKEAVVASQSLSDDQKQEQVEVINQLGDEAAKPKPNKTMLKMLKDGLMETLKTVPDIAKAVTAVAPVLSTLL